MPSPTVPAHGPFSRASASPGTVPPRCSLGFSLPVLLSSPAMSGPPRVVHATGDGLPARRVSKPMLAVACRSQALLRALGHALELAHARGAAGARPVRLGTVEVGPLSRVARLGLEVLDPLRAGAGGHQSPR